jgi:hypothetical protein
VPYFITEGTVASANLIALASWESGSIYPIDRDTKTVRGEVVGTYGTLAGGADVGVGLTAGRSFGAWWVDNVPAIGGSSMIYSYSIVVGAGFGWADIKHTDRSGEIVDGKACPYGQSATVFVGGEISASPSLSIAYTWL